MALGDNIIAYWKLDGNSNDSQGTNNGTDTNITYSAGNGILVQGAGFNGTDSKIDAGTGLADPTTGISVQSWMNVAVWPGASSFPTAFNKTTGSTPFGGYSIFCYLNGVTQCISYGLNVNGVWQSPNSTTARVTATWYHCVLTYDGTTIKFYVNNVEDTDTRITTSGNVQYQSSTASVLFGKNGGAANFLNGAVDEVGIWTRALSGTEISQLYNSGHALSFPFPKSNLSLLGVG